MTISANSFSKTKLRLILASGSVMVLTACAPGGLSNLDWDLRSNGGSTAESARLATASRPVPDANGVLSYPNYQLVQARRGDNVISVAQRMGMNPAELARGNGLQPTDPLREGELLLLPRRVSATPQPLVSASPSAMASAPVDITSRANSALDRVETSALPPVSTTPLASSSNSSQPAAPLPFALESSQPAASASIPGGGKEPNRHVVKRGETASIIARNYNVSAQSLAEWNNLDAKMSLREGQTLIIPVATGAAPKAEPRTSAPGAGSATPVPPSATKPLPNEKTQPAAEATKNTPASPDLGAARTTATASKLAMPVSGSIIRGYNKKTNQGIDISAAAGTSVKAAEAGTVALRP